MLVFCPTCGNVLTVSRMPMTADADPSTAGKNRWECRSCPYSFMLQTRFYERRPMTRKEVEDVLGGKDSWKNVDKTTVQCPNDRCQNTEAYFFQQQIRSADEPMTVFYKCTECGRQWKE